MCLCIQTVSLSCTLSSVPSGECFSSTTSGAFRTCTVYSLIQSNSPFTTLPKMSIYRQTILSSLYSISPLIHPISLYCSTLKNAPLASHDDSNNSIWGEWPRWWWWFWAPRYCTFPQTHKHLESDLTETVFRQPPSHTMPNTISNTVYTQFWLSLSHPVILVVFC